MGKVDIYKSIVDNNILSEFETQRGVCLLGHSANSNFIDDFISAAYILCPNFIEVDGHVFHEHFYNSTVENALASLEGLKKQFNNDKKHIEQWINSTCFGDFFIGKDCKSMDNDKILYQFGDILVYFWTQRLKELFPDRKFIVEYGDDIPGEEGWLAITMYEVT